MQEKGMKVNLITFNAAITALAKAAKRSKSPNANYPKSRRAEVENDGQLYQRALQLLEQMERNNIKPDGFSYSSAISCCGAEGRWEEALELMDRMRKGGPRTRPNRVAYTAAISACGRSGEYTNALRLFRDMKDEGLAADIVAYNALFNALRVGKQPDVAYELWEEMCGTKQSNATKAIATARADKGTVPDIITISDVIATLAENGQKGYQEKLDEVFTEAVERGVVLRSDTLDSTWEVDLSGMSFPVARAACRYVLKKKLHFAIDELDDLTFITGVGVGNRPFAGKPVQSPPGTNRTVEQSKYTSLRDYLQEEVLRDDFDPPIESFIPKRAQGMVQIDRSQLQRWARQNSSKQ